MQLQTDAVTVSKATAADLQRLVQCDAYAVEHPERRQFIARAIEQGECWYASAAGYAQGYVVLTYSFFENGFIPLVVVSGGARRRGIAQRLLAAAEQECKTPKLFASTNASNIEAQRLLARAGFVPSGRIENLEAGDPELVYFKQCSAGQNEL